jgi:hypothetical protein
MLRWYLLSETPKQNQQLPARCEAWSGYVIATRQQSLQCLHVRKSWTSNREVCEVRVKYAGPLRTGTLDYGLFCLSIVTIFCVERYRFIIIFFCPLIMLFQPLMLCRIRRVRWDEYKVMWTCTSRVQALATVEKSLVVRWLSWCESCYCCICTKVVPHSVMGPIRPDFPGTVPVLLV